MKKNLFIDLGTHLGGGISEFVKMFKMNEENWEVHSFEPQPLIFSLCSQGHASAGKFNEAKSTVPSIQLHQAAASTSDGEATLFFELPMSVMTEGSSIVTDVAENNRRDFQGDKTVVRTVDIIKFIDSLSRENSRENIIIKMDVEGAEFDILNQLFERCEKGFKFNASNVEIFCEFHHRLFGGWEHQERKEKPDPIKYPPIETYVEKFERHGIRIHSWI